MAGCQELAFIKRAVERHRMRETARECVCVSVGRQYSPTHAHTHCLNLHAVIQVHSGL